MLLADRSDEDWIRAIAAEKGERANIRHCNLNDPLQPYLYRARNLVERFFNMIKHRCRMAARCDKLAANFLRVRPTCIKRAVAT